MCPSHMMYKHLTLPQSFDVFVTVLLTLIYHYLRIYPLMTVAAICHSLPGEHTVDQMPVNPAAAELISQCLCSVWGCVYTHTARQTASTSISVNSRGYNTDLT